MRQAHVKDNVKNVDVAQPFYTSFAERFVAEGS
jgi:hypothetical protein